MNGMMNNMFNLNNRMMNNHNNMNLNNKDTILDLVNLNIQMANQIAMNNNMIKTNIENSNLGNINQNNDNLKELLKSIELFPLRNGRRINILFKETTTGFQLTIFAPSDISVKGLLEAFYIKFQIYAIIHNIVIKNLRDYTFIFNGHTIFFDEQKTISEFGLINKVEQIVFYPKDNLIGG